MPRSKPSQIPLVARPKASGSSYRPSAPSCDRRMMAGRRVASSTGAGRVPWLLLGSARRGERTQACVHARTRLGRPCRPFAGAAWLLTRPHTAPAFTWPGHQLPTPNYAWPRGPQHNTTESSMLDRCYKQRKNKLQMTSFNRLMVYACSCS